MRGWKNYHLSKKQKRAYKLRKELEYARREVAEGEIQVAKERVIAYINKNISTHVKKIDKKEVRRLLETIREAKDHGTMYDAIRQSQRIIDDINNLTTEVRFKAMQKKLKPEKLLNNKSAIWKAIKRAKPEEMANDKYLMEEIVELMKKPFDNVNEIESWWKQYHKVQSKYHQNLRNIEKLKTEEEIQGEIDANEKAQIKKGRVQATKENKAIIRIVDLSYMIKSKWGKEAKNKDVKFQEEFEILTNPRLEDFAPHYPKESDRHGRVFHSKADMINYEKALIGLYQTGELSQFAGDLVQKIESIRISDQFIKDTEGFDFNEMGWVSRNLRTASAMIAELGRWNMKVVDSLNKAVFGGLRHASGLANDRYRAIAKDVRKVITKNKLGLDNFIRVQHLGNMLTTEFTTDDGVLYLDDIKRNVAYFQESLKSKLDAVKTGDYKLQKEADVLNEIEIFNEVKNIVLDDTKDNLSALSKGELEYYQYMRNVLDELLPEIEHVTNVHLGKDFKPLFDYTPLVGIGKKAKEGGIFGGIRELQVDGLQIDKIMSDFESQSGLKALESRHVKARTSAKGVYYNNNSFSVFDTYVQSILFDIHAARAIGTTHKLLSSKAMRDVLGAKNVKTLYDKNKKAVEMTRMNVTRYSQMVRTMEKYKGLYLTSQIGNVKQFLNQTVSMLPANVMINPKGAIKVAKMLPQWNNPTFWKEHPDTNVKSMDDWFHKYGAGIQLRDVLMEKLGSPRSFESGAARTSEKFENLTTAPLRMADGFSARIQFLSAFLELGGDIHNPDKDIILQAELRTDLTQNISDPKFAANMFLGNTNDSRVVHTLFWFLKSFAANMSLNSISAARHAFNKGDTRMANAFIGQAVLGGMIFSALGYGWRMLYKTLADLVTDADDEKDEEEVLKDFFINMGGAVISDIGLAWMPSILENVLKTRGNKIWTSLWKANEGTDLEDYSPFYSDDSLRSAAGGYAPMMDIFDDVMDSFTELITGDFDSWDMHDALYIMSQVVSFAPIIPMRGDTKRVFLEMWKSFERDKKAEEARMKQQKRAPRGIRLRKSPVKNK
jgi:hypothetical protein